MGTGAIEIKSGYGLTTASELKMLRVIKRLKENTEVTIKATFLGAHALPQEFKDNKKGYMDLVINEMLPKIAEEKLEMYNVIFDKEKMTLKIPTIKAKEIGIRKVSSRNEMKKTLEILKGKAKIRRTMWSRRAQEYEAKINSGILTELTEVVRDLFRNSSQPEQSYSERQLYESARDRLAREVAVVEKTDDDKAVDKIEIILNDATRKSSSENSII